MRASLDQRGRGPVRASTLAFALLGAVSFAPVARAQAPAPAPALPVHEPQQQPPSHEPAAPPRASPLYGPPVRHGIGLDVAIGLALCQPALLYSGVCRRQAGGRGPAPGVALRLGAGWRFNPNWYLSGAWVRQAHRPGGSFATGTSDAGMLAVRGILPLATPTGADSRVDLGFELGLGWSQRVLTRDVAPHQLSSSGALVRPALILDGWILADFSMGLEFATQLNFHWQHCVDDVCQPAPGDWVASDLDRRWVDGFTIALRMSGLVFPRL